MAADLSFRLGWLESEEVARIANLYQRAGLPVIPPQELTAEDYLRLMAVDKKVKKGIIRLILLKKIGEAEIVSDYTTAQLKATLDSFSKA
jgi:3-dehydroquinate synthase